MEASDDPPPPSQAEKENKRRSGPPPSSAPACRFFSQGRHCQFGRRCRFLHQREEDEHTLQGLENRLERVEDGGAAGCKKLEDGGQGAGHNSTQTHRESSRDVAGGGHQPCPQPRSASGRRERARKPCRYFLSGYCAMEDRCRFWHPEQLPSLEDPRSASERVTPKEPVARPMVVQDVVKLSELTSEIAMQLRNTEINQLTKRFPKDKLIIQEREDGQLTYYRVTVQPTDPDWPFDLKDIDIMVSFPQMYPQEVFTLDIPEDQDLPSIMGRYVCQASQEWLLGKHATNELMGKVELLFRPFLRWLDRNMERLFTEGARLLKRDIDAERSGIEFVPYQQLQVAASSEETAEDLDENLSSDDGDSDAESYSGSEEDGEDGGGVEGTPPGEECSAGEATSHPVENVKSVAPRKGTEVKLMGLQLGEGTATVVASEITVSLQCNRCKVTADLTLRGELPCTAQCEKCSASIIAAFRPSMLHHYSSVLGFLDITGAVPVDLVLQDCELLVGCLSCSQEGPLQNVPYGQMKEVNCQHCHSKLSILVESTTFQLIQPRNRTGQKDSLQNRQKRFPRDPAVQLGKPLPEKGTCKHFKQSHRWLRFSCCGRAYPCDACHDEDQDHGMEMATRMICGFCAKEQPYNNGKPCVSCGSMMTRGSHSSHWEGGLGCRNKVKMSRNDRQKYSNLSKAVSRKSKTAQK
ncbi:uncharacterized protein LOC136748243 [Amia ocellicauda]|uniref:uncharacterized protein LOC136748243 n=1 Tax=Amia ocellicauda TaxID=2972642 RepID=UPI00346430D3